MTTIPSKSRIWIRPALALGLATVFLATVFLATVFLAAPVQADSTPDAQKWLDKLVGLYDKAPFTNEYTATLDMQQGEQSISGAIKGRIIYGDAEHMRVNMEVTMAGMPGMPQGEEAAEMTMKMLSVTDGETTWSEIEMPMMGKQVTKLALEDAKAFAGQPNMGANPTGFDPVQQLEAMAEALDFEVLKVADGEVHLKATVTPEARGQLGQLGMVPGTETFHLVLDTDSGTPKSITIGGDKPILDMTFGPFEFISDDSIPEGTFTYTVPEGTQVMDLGALMQQVQ